MLLIPILHAPCLAVLNSEEIRNELKQIIEEITDYLQSQFNETCVIYERNVPMKQQQQLHMHLQIIPFKSSKALDAQSLFQDLTNEQDINFQKVADIASQELEENVSPYFFVYLPGIQVKGKRTLETFAYYLKNKQDVQFFMQFGRQFACSLLEIQDFNNVDWKKAQFVDEIKCAQTLRSKLK